MDCQLADFERKHGLKNRWKKEDQEYTDARKAFLNEKQKQLHSCLWATVVKRHYLLCMKAKYAGKLHILCTRVCLIAQSISISA